MTDQPTSDGPPDTAVSVAANAIAAFADQHQIPVPADLREDLARTVFAAAWPHVNASKHRDT